MLESISDGLRFVIEVIRINITNFLNTYYTSGEVLRVGLGIGVAISIIFMVVKLIKGASWGS